MVKLTREALHIDLSETRVPRNRFARESNASDSHIGVSPSIREVASLGEALRLGIPTWHSDTQSVSLLYSAVNHEERYEFYDPGGAVFDMITGEAPISYNTALITLIKNVIADSPPTDLPVFIYQANCCIVKPEHLTNDYLTKRDGLFIICVTPGVSCFERRRYKIN